MKEVTLDISGKPILEQFQMLVDSIGCNTVIGVNTCNVEVWRDGTVVISLDGLVALTIRYPIYTNVSSHYG